MSLEIPLKRMRMKDALTLPSLKNMKIGEKLGTDHFGDLYFTFFAQEKNRSCSMYQMSLEGYIKKIFANLSEMSKDEKYFSFLQKFDQCIFLDETVSPGLSNILYLMDDGVIDEIIHEARIPDDLNDLFEKSYESTIAPVLMQQQQHSEDSCLPCYGSGIFGHSDSFPWWQGNKYYTYHTYHT
jgi:hypothetical protein